MELCINVVAATTTTGATMHMSNADGWNSPNPGVDCKPDNRLGMRDSNAFGKTLKSFISQSFGSISIQTSSYIRATLDPPA